MPDLARSTAGRVKSSATYLPSTCSSCPPSELVAVTNADSDVRRARAPAETLTSEGAAPTGRAHAMAGLTKSTLEKLARLGITRELDLVLHLPLRYDDETRLYAINEAPAGQDVLVQGSVVEC